MLLLTTQHLSDVFPAHVCNMNTFFEYEGICKMFTLCWCKYTTTYCESCFHLLLIVVTESRLSAKSTFYNFAEEKYKVANKNTTSEAPETNYLKYSCIIYVQSRLLACMHDDIKPSAYT